MKTIIVSLLFFSLTIFSTTAQSIKQDSLAVLLIDRMSDVIGDLESCHFTLSTTTDVPDLSFGFVKELAVHEVYLSGPDKMLVNTHNQKGHQQLMYNGYQLAYYSFDENNFGLLPTPATTIQTIDSVHANFGIEFPAADFFYPTFTDDLLAEADIIKFLGIVRVENKEYFHIVSSGKEKKFELWVNNDAYNLPAKFAITYTTRKGTPQYQATFSDWQINPVLPEAMFDFLPPVGATQIRIMSKNEKPN